MALPVEDILAIQKLAADYNHLIDSGSAEAWAQLFVPDGTLEFGMPEGVKGHEDLVAFAAAINPATRHVISNLSIDGDRRRGGGQRVLGGVLHRSSRRASRELIITGVYRDHLAQRGWAVALCVAPDDARSGRLGARPRDRRRALIPVPGQAADPGAGVDHHRLAELADEGVGGLHLGGDGIEQLHGPLGNLGVKADQVQLGVAVGRTGASPEVPECAGGRPHR